MKNKIFNSYAIVWAIFLVIFNVVAFVPQMSYYSDEFTPGFWVGYLFITLAFIGQLICGYITLKPQNLTKTFYNISILQASYTGLIATVIAGAICMLVEAIPHWLGIIICFIVLALNVVSVIKASVVTNIVSGIDEKIKTQTFFIKALTANAESLVTSAKSDDARAECQKVYEAARFSDPMSNEALALADEQIANSFSALVTAVENDDLSAVKSTAEAILNQLKARNSRCKLLK